MIPNGVMLALIVGAGLLLVGSALPAPTDGASLTDVTVTANLDWGELSRKWTIESLDVSVQESKWVNFKAFFSNLLSLESPDLDMLFTLETANGAVATEHGSTGSILWGKTKETVVFREIPPGTYTLRVQILDGASTLAEKTRNVTLQEA